MCAESLEAIGTFFGTPAGGNTRFRFENAKNTLAIDELCLRGGGCTRRSRQKLFALRGVARKGSASIRFCGAETSFKKTASSIPDIHNCNCADLRSFSAFKRISIEFVASFWFFSHVRGFFVLRTQTLRQIRKVLSITQVIQRPKNSIDGEKKHCRPPWCRCVSRRITRILSFGDGGCFWICPRGVDTKFVALIINLLIAMSERPFWCTPSNARCFKPYFSACTWWKEHSTIDSLATVECVKSVDAPPAPA